MTYQEASNIVWSAYRDGVTLSMEQTTKGQWVVTQPDWSVRQSAKTVWNHSGWSAN